MLWKERGHEFLTVANKRQRAVKAPGHSSYPAAKHAIIGTSIFYATAGSSNLVQTMCLAAELDRLRADARRMRECLIVMSETQVGGGSFRFVSAEVATAAVTAETLRRRFS